MALNATEQQIAAYGAKNGKSQAEVQQAILKYRAQGAPAPAKVTLPPKPNLLSSVGSQIKDAAKAGVLKAVEGNKEANPSNKGGGVLSSVGHLVEGVGKELGGAAEVVTAPIAPLLKPLGYVINKVGDKISDIPAVQKFANTPAGNAAIHTASTIGDYANAAGVVAGGIDIANHAPVGIETVKAALESKPELPKGPPGSKTVLSPVRDSVTHLPADVTHVLKTAADPAAVKTEFQNALVEGKKSITTGGKELSPYEIVGRDHISTGMKKLDDILTTSGQAISEHADKFKDTPVTDIATEGLEKLKNLTQARLGTVFNGLEGAANATGKTFEQHIQGLNDTLSGNTNISLDTGLFGDAEGRKSLVTKSSDKALLAKTFASLQNLAENGATAQHLSDTIKNINEDLDFQQSSKPAIQNTRTEGVVKQVLGSLNEELTRLGEDVNGNNPYAEAKATFSTAKKFKTDLEKRLGGEVGNGDGYKNSASLLIRRLSPQDSGTRAVLRQFEDITGVPVFQHAIIAKFAMDVLKDTRVKSVLESISDGRATKQGLVQSIWHTIVNAVKDPEGKAIRILDERIGKQGTQAIYDAVKKNKSQLTGGTLGSVKKQK